MSNSLRKLHAIPVVAFFALLAGCYSTPSLETEYVEGLVTLDGAPVSDATVTFVPLEPGQGSAGVGVSDASGIYRLSTLSSREGLKPKHGAGVLPGQYQVGVEKIEIPAEIQARIDAGESVPLNPASLKRVIPSRFADPEKSGLVVEVVPGSNDIPLAIRSK